LLLQDATRLGLALVDEPTVHEGRVCGELHRSSPLALPAFP
jgi:hypothetical protein